MVCFTPGFRVFDPKIQELDGSHEFKLYHPDYRPISRFDVSHTRRHGKSIVARRDGAVNYLEGKLGVMRIDLAGSFAKSADVSGTETMRDEFAGHWLRKDWMFRLFKYDDRYTNARLLSASFPRGREVTPETDWALKCESYDPYWYDAAGDQSCCLTFGLGGEMVIPIGGEAPTPLRLVITVPDDCSCIMDLQVIDVGAQALDVATKGYGKHVWQFGDVSCQVCPGEIMWDSDDGNRQITTSNADCSAPLEHFTGYWFHSGPGDTTISFDSPSSPGVACMLTVCAYWINRWYTP